MYFSIEPLTGRALLPFPQAEEFLQAELAERLKITATPKRYGELLYYPDFPYDTLDGTTPAPDSATDRAAEAQTARKATSAEALDTQQIYFARTQMLKPFLLKFASIGQAATALKSMQRNWAPYQYQFFRRAELIQQKLPHIKLSERDFPTKIPLAASATTPAEQPTDPTATTDRAPQTRTYAPMGLYTLIDETTILASAQTSSVLPAGAIQFKEDHENPPSRAYLKLQEALLHANIFFGTDYPTQGQRCLDTGASPGGWTWLLTKLGATVLAIDRAPLDPRLMSHPLVEFRAHDAFTLPPSDIGKCDWVFSDVICYPDRLFEWTQKWTKSRLATNMICTIKMQGGIDWRAVQNFAREPNSRIVHLNYNKHELTWLWHNPDG